MFNVFPSKRIRNTEQPTNFIHFQIKRGKRRVKNTDKKFEAISELENLISSGASISGHGGEKQVGRKATSRGRNGKSANPRFNSVQ